MASCLTWREIGLEPPVNDVDQSRPIPRPTQRVSIRPCSSPPVHLRWLPVWLPRASPANHSDQRPGRRQAQSLTLKRQQTSATTLDWNRNIQIETTEAKSNGIHTYNLGDNLKLIRRNRQLTLPHSQRDLQSDQFP